MERCVFFREWHLILDLMPMPAFYVALMSSRAHVSTTTSQEWITSFLTDQLNLWDIICLRNIHQSAQCWCEKKKRKQKHKNTKKKQKRTKRNYKCPYIVPWLIWILVANLMHLLNTYQRSFFIFFFFFKENEKPNYSFERLKSFATLNLLSFLERHP